MNPSDTERCETFYLYTNTTAQDILTYCSDNDLNVTIMGDLDELAEGDEVTVWGSDSALDELVEKFG